ncbi:hypothetical protein HDR58_06180, partial [bacterium]|nr:hypothetical protein [bacterium]
SGEYGYITREEMERRESSKISAGMREKGYSEVLHVTRNDSDLQRMLNKYQGHEDDFALGFGVRVAENCPDGSTKAGGGHALSVVKITDTTVYVANSWNPDQIEPIPRKEFEKMATEFTATKMNNRAVSQNYLQNSLNNVALGAGGSVSSADMASLSAILGRINLGNSHTQPSGGSNRIIPEKVQAYLNHFNNNHNNSPNKLNMNKLLKYLNNVSKKEVNKEQQDFVARMYKQITSSKEVELSKDDVKILKSLTDK